MRKQVIFSLLMGITLGWVQISWAPFAEGDYNRPVVGEKPSEPSETPTWWNGGLQSDWEKAGRNRLPLFPFALRIRNQIKFELLDNLPANRVRIGAYDWLMRTEIIQRKTRPKKFKDFENLMDNWASLANWMAAEGKFLYFILNANKHHVLTTEDIMDSGVCPSHSKNFEKTFDARMKDAFEARNLQAFVVGPWLKAVHDTSQAPMWPRNGIHCSVASAELIVDSAMHALSELWSMKLPQRIKLGGEWDTKARWADEDLEKSCNLLWDLPDDSLWYPSFDWDFSQTPRNTLPRVMRIGDSFGNQLHQYGGFAAAFHPSSRRFHYAREEVKYGLQFNEREVLETKVTSDVLQRELHASKGLVVEYSEATFIRHSENFFHSIEPILQEARLMSNGSLSGTTSATSSSAD